ncbi:Metallo-dependent phosphatase-like protein [Zopfochytrium polystomum]|nr:Metallo-dependent phosphatase-like protein [Zopfochytrium polystomum]
MAIRDEAGGAPGPSSWDSANFTGHSALRRVANATCRRAVVVGLAVLTVLAATALLLCLPFVDRIGPLTAQKSGNARDSSNSSNKLSNDSRANASVNATASARPLAFSSSLFRIAIFTDLHFGEAPSTDWGPQQDRNTTRVMKAVLVHELAGSGGLDLVVLDGDQVTGEDIVASGQNNLTHYLDFIYEPMEALAIPWASVLGNHDDGGVQGDDPVQQPGEFSRKEAVVHEMRKPLSLTREGPPNVTGITNYWLPIMAEANDSAPAAVLFFLDSGGSAVRSGVANYIQSSQIDWFQQESASVQETYGSIPVLVFLHIPVMPSKSLNDAPDFETACDGLRDETNIATQSMDVGLWAAITNGTNVVAVFSGHDHGTSWCCPLAGVEVCFGRHTGYGGYGDWPRGARVVELILKEDSTGRRTAALNRTYVRLESGTLTDEHRSQL